MIAYFIVSVHHISQHYTSSAQHRTKARTGHQSGRYVVFSQLRGPSLTRLEGSSSNERLTLIQVSEVAALIRFVEVA